MQSMESIAQKIMVTGVIIDFEKTGPDPEPVSDGMKSFIVKGTLSKRTH